MANDEHPEHELWIDRRSADLAVERLQLLAKLGQHARHNRIDPAQEMAHRNALFEIEQVELLAPIARLSSHHRRITHAESPQRRIIIPCSPRGFLNSIGPLQMFGMSCFGCLSCDLTGLSTPLQTRRLRLAGKPDRAKMVNGGVARVMRGFAFRNRRNPR